MSSGFINHVISYNNMRIEHQHKLSFDEANKRIKNLLFNLQKEHADKISNVSMDWITNKNMQYNLIIMGSGVNGQIILEEKLVILEGNIPFKFLFFSSQIENMIKQELTKLLS